MATRALLDMLRQSGKFGGGPSPFAKVDRSRFLSKLDELIHASRARIEAELASNGTADVLALENRILNAHPLLVSI